MYWEKLAGTSFRQDEIDKLTGEEDIRLVAEPDNKYDSSAVRVEANGVLIGYIPKGRNKEIADILISGSEVKVDEWSITGGMDGKNYGVNVHIILPISDQLKHMKRLDSPYTQKTILFDERHHRYFDEEGNPLQSGSGFEEEQVGTPDLSFAAKAIAKATGLQQSEVQDMWDKHGEASRDFGTLLHSCLDYFFSNYSKLYQYAINRELDMSATLFFPATIGKIIDDYAEFMPTDDEFTASETETFIQWGSCCGVVDRIHYLDENTCEIIDYKTTSNDKVVKTKDFGELDKYTLQQNFYRSILEHYGLTVEAMKLHVWDGDKWSEKTLKRVDLGKVINDFA